MGPALSSIPGPSGGPRGPLLLGTRGVQGPAQLLERLKAKRRQDIHPLWECAQEGSAGRIKMQKPECHRLCVLSRATQQGAEAARRKEQSRYVPG